MINLINQSPHPHSPYPLSLVQLGLKIWSGPHLLFFFFLLPPFSICRCWTRYKCTLDPPSTLGYIFYPKASMWLRNSSPCSWGKKRIQNLWSKYSVNSKQEEKTGVTTDNWTNHFPSPMTIWSQGIVLLTLQVTGASPEPCRMKIFSIIGTVLFLFTYSMSSLWALC